MPTEIADRPEVRAILVEVNDFETFATNYQVTTPAQYEAGAADLMRVNGAIERLDAMRTGITGPMNKALKAVNDLFRTPGDRLASAKRAIKAKLIAYADEQERIQREEQRKANEAAQKERDRLQALAAKAQESGRTAAAEKHEERAAAVVPAVIHREPPKVAGLTSREVWKFEITDAALIPREFLIVDEARVRRVVQAMKGDTKIAGVRVYAERQLASGAA